MDGPEAVLGSISYTCSRSNAEFVFIFLPAAPPAGKRRRASLNGAMFRASVLFVLLAALVAGVSAVSRSLLHLDCIGPVLPAWGCLAVPYPDSIPGGQPAYYAAIAVGAWIACYLVRNAVFAAAAFMVSRFSPNWLRQYGGEGTEQRTYPLR